MFYTVGVLSQHDIRPVSELHKRYCLLLSVTAETNTLRKLCMVAFSAVVDETVALDGQYSDFGRLDCLSED